MSLITRSVVSVDDLDASLDDPNLAVIEVYAAPPGEAVIPGARTAFWKDLAWHPLERELASGEELSERLFRLGAGEGSRIVLAGEPTQFAAYVLWTLRVRGYTDIAYLDGGLEAWKAAGLPTGGSVRRAAPAAPLTVPEPTAEQERLRIGRDEVRALLGRDDVVLLDYRTPQEYSGARVSGPSAPIDHGAERHGRIPGAKHLFFRDLLDEHGRLRDRGELQRIVDEKVSDSASLIVNYCRLSHRSTLGWIALSEVLGFDNVRVYDGSWTEWGSIVGFPVER
ncbi:thiosulfate/3-mercaptopyruvate sulfurtransferase [Mycolicibacterium iranicum]|uniref:Sulfurtransferase n=1 Tax=Mycolicibacterium iranicum TaxID=912594 RepID=A0A839Q2V1_MYCIR|nr:rhodanese-like domain-containing protein [Mycolicibacterium iranicum]MBB2989743.1 thiosulfate/3-mercaptopyruvate sulfurtransferase [Mycolicibacterium iranicum]